MLGVTWLKFHKRSGAAGTGSTSCFRIVEVPEDRHLALSRLPEARKDAGFRGSAMWTLARELHRRPSHHMSSTRLWNIPRMGLNKLNKRDRPKSSIAKRFGDGPHKLKHVRSNQHCHRLMRNKTTFEQKAEKSRIRVKLWHFVQLPIQQSCCFGRSC